MSRLPFVLLMIAVLTGLAAGPAMAGDEPPARLLY